MPEFEWDPAKESLNFIKHGFNFQTASLIWDSDVVERTDSRQDYGETRIIAIGKAAGCAMVVVYTYRGGNRRIISARKANSREKEFYESEVPRRGGTPRD